MVSPLILLSSITIELSVLLLLFCVCDGAMRYIVGEAGEAAPIGIGWNFRLRSRLGSLPSLLTSFF